MRATAPVLSSEDRDPSAPRLIGERSALSYEDIPTAPEIHSKRQRQLYSTRSIGP